MRAAPLLFAIGCVAETGELVALVPPPEPPPPVKMGGVEISPSAIDFGSVLLGESAERRLRVANRGSEPVTLHWSLLPGPFEVAPSSLHFEPGMRELTVLFTPRRLGTFTGEIYFDCEGCSSVQLEGAAHEDELGDPIECNDVSLRVEAGSCASTNILCTNSAPIDLEVFSAHIAGDPSFALTRAATRLPAGEFGSFDIEFCPPEGGWFSAELVLVAVSEIGREYGDRAVMIGEAPVDEPPPPPPPPGNYIECMSFPEPWVIGPIPVGQLTSWGVHCRTQTGTPLVRAELVPAVPGTATAVLDGTDPYYDSFVIIDWVPQSSGEVETALELEAEDARRTIPMHLIGE